MQFCGVITRSRTAIVHWLVVFFFFFFVIDWSPHKATNLCLQTSVHVENHATCTPTTGSVLGYVQLSHVQHFCAPLCILKQQKSLNVRLEISSIVFIANVYYLKPHPLSMVPIYKCSHVYVHHCKDIGKIVYRAVYGAAIKWPSWHARYYIE